MKRAITILLAVLCVLGATGTLGGCDSDPAPLRICIESPLPGDYFPADAFAYNFVSNAKDYGIIDSVEDVEIEVIPCGLGRDEERKGVLTRLRTEIAAGKGPDIFIIGHLADGGRWGEDTLFRYPERAIAQNRFLKLDDYIADAQFMEWDKLYSPVMEAGKTGDGQFLLPMTYSFYVTIFNTAEEPAGLTSTTTWYDMLASPDPLVQYAARVPDGTLSDGITSIFGRVSEKQSDTLTLSRGQLESVCATGAGCSQEPKPEGLPEAYHIDLKLNFDEPGLSGPENLRDWNMKMVPMCSITGGATATVTSYCGINANTKRPKEAFKLLDLFMSKEFQQYSGLYGGFLKEGLPVYEGLMQEEAPAQRWYFTDENYQAFLDARSLISSVKFRTPADQALHYGYRVWSKGNGGDILDEVYRDMEMGLAES